MATPIQKKAEEKYVKDDKKKPGDGTENGAGSAAGDGSQTGAGSAAGDGTETGTGSAAGDGTETGAGSAVGDGTETGTGSAAGDGTETGVGSAVGDDTETSTDAKPHWFTVQVVRSPSGRRFRAGVEFTSEPKPYDFSLFSDEQLKALAADPFLRIKPFTPAEE
ncbi:MULTISPECIES: hypothetical protein [Serratia]|uniref:hypothetical protein n=1 Tax=Serratia TaxID=613 RepID=UPI0007453FCD|nr:hypothetical protein [Serratia marcescens]EME1465803.1 hypothetical protein [Serratia marcescens]MDP8746792.1 hypothetical protein [Serratia marcescens]CUZ00858.1 Uncharacterised protein [Serratia marcescens]CUZ13527.1 Uncharacterised protein [Serratia marcescens]CVB76702.1 Uncharacterised protein [Serratia marcescens]